MGKLNGVNDDKRLSMRFDKVFPVRVVSEAFGEMNVIARNISSGGICLEMIDPLPMGAMVTIHFVEPTSQAEVAARAEVKHHYAFNFSVDSAPSRAQGIGLRFVEFLNRHDSKTTPTPSSRSMH